MAFGNQCRELGKQTLRLRFRLRRLVVTVKSTATATEKLKNKNYMKRILSFLFGSMLVCTEQVKAVGEELCPELELTVPVGKDLCRCEDPLAAGW